MSPTIIRNDVKEDEEDDSLEIYYDASDQIHELDSDSLDGVDDILNLGISAFFDRLRDGPRLGRQRSDDLYELYSTDGSYGSNDDQDESDEVDFFNEEMQSGRGMGDDNCGLAKYAHYHSYGNFMPEGG